MHLSALVLLGTLLSLVNADPELVLGNTTFRGVVETVDSQEIEVFRGIPYGERTHAFRPVSPIKFTHRKPKTLDATKALYSCPQLGNFSVPPDAKSLKSFLDELMEDGGTTEDIMNCANLHVYRTKKAHKAMGIFYVHGGGMESGSPEANINRASGIFGHPDLHSKHGLVVFNVGYPLGPWSATVQVEEGAETDGVEDITVHNNALRDLITALKMIQDNAKALGVDPKKMTIVGHSAGAALVHKLQFVLVNAKDYGLEKIAKHVRFILMGGTDFLFPSISQEEALRRRDELVSHTTCASKVGRVAQYQCLEKLSQRKIIAAAREAQVVWGPIIDEDLQLSDTETHLRNGLYLANPTLVTMTMDEASLFTIRHLKTAQEEGMKALKKLGQGKKTIKFMEKHYKNFTPRSRERHNYEALTRGLTESVFVKSALKLKELTKDRMKGKLFLYQFNFPYDALQSFGAQFALCATNLACKVGLGKYVGENQLEECAHYLSTMGLFHGADQLALFRLRLKDRGMEVTNIVRKATISDAMAPTFEFMKSGAIVESQLTTHLSEELLLEAPVNSEAIVNAIYGNALGDPEIVKLDDDEKLRLILETSVKHPTGSTSESKSREDSSEDGSHSSRESSDESREGTKDKKRRKGSEDEGREPKPSAAAKKAKRVSSHKTHTSDKPHVKKASHARKESSSSSVKKERHTSKDKKSVHSKDKADKKVEKKAESPSLFARLFSRGGNEP